MKKLNIEFQNDEIKGLSTYCQDPKIGFQNITHIISIPKFIIEDNVYGIWALMRQNLSWSFEKARLKPVSSATQTI